MAAHFRLFVRISNTWEPRFCEHPGYQLLTSGIVALVLSNMTTLSVADALRWQTTIIQVSGRFSFNSLHSLVSRASCYDCVFLNYDLVKVIAIQIHGGSSR